MSDAHKLNKSTNDAKNILNFISRRGFDIMDDSFPSQLKCTSAVETACLNLVKKGLERNKVKLWYAAGIFS